MPRPSKFDDAQILEAAAQLSSDGQAITGYAISVRLGGGRPSSLAERYAELTANQEKPVELPALPNELAATIEKAATEVTQRLTAAMTEAHAQVKAQAHIRIDEVEAELAVARKQHATELDDAAGHLDAMQDRAEVAEAALAEARAELAKATAAGQELQAKLTRAEDLLTASKEREKSHEALEAELREELRELHKQTNKDAAEIQRLLADAKEKLTAKTEALKQRDEALSKAEEANKQREAAAREASGNAARAEQLQASEKRLQGELSQLNQQTGKQSAELVQAVKDREGLQQKLSEQAKSLAEAQSEISKLKSGKPGA